MITMHCTMEEIGGSSDICHLTPPSHTKPYQTIPKVQGSQGSMVQGSKVARYLKVIFKYELDSKEGPSCIILLSSSGPGPSLISISKLKKGSELTL